MRASSFIAGRLRFRGNLAMASIAVSFLVMISAVAISSGFKHSIRDGITALTGDIQITRADMDYLGGDKPVPSHLSFEDDLLSVKGVRSISPAVYRAGIVKNGDILSGVLVKGVPGFNNDSTTLGVSIPLRLSEITGLGAGDDLTTYFVGDKMKVRKFHIVEVYRGALQTGSNLLVYADLSDMQRLNEWDEDEVSALEISLDRVSGMEAGRIVSTAGSMLLLSSVEEEQELLATSSTKRYSRLFDWLNLLDFNVLFILGLMTVVAGFNMISGLLILLFRNIATIGTLKTLGMKDRSIASVFLRMSSVLVLKGMLIGNGVALLFCLVQGTTHVLKLNPENYFVSYVPVHVDFIQIFAADAISFAFIMLLLLLPSLFISRIDPATTVRAK